MAIDVRIPVDAWAALAELAPAPKTSVSPLNLAPVAPAAGDANDRALSTALAAAGVEREDADLGRALSVLARTTAACHVLVGGSRVTEVTTFAAPDGGACVCLATDGDGLRLQDPAPVDDVMVVLEHLLGGSAFRGVELEADLTVPEALVLAALVDDRRAGVLRALLDGVPAEPVSVTPAAVRTAVAERATRVFWLTGVIAQWCAADAALDATAVRDALKGLEGKGFVRNGRRVGLTEPADELGTRLLVVDKVVQLQRVIARGADLDRLGFTCLQAGVHDLLMMEHVGDSVHLETVPANLLLSYVDTFLRDPLAGAGSTAWTATHTVPAGGMTAWVETDPASASVQLIAGTPLRLESTSGAWARVSAEDGWSGWVDGRILGVPTG